MKADPTKLPILVSYELTCIFAAIPKRRGRGYLKVPAGHQHEEWLSEAESLWGVRSIAGLDGWLEIELHSGEDARAVFAKLLQILMQEFRCDRAEEAPLDRVLGAHKKKFPQKA